MDRWILGAICCALSVLIYSPVLRSPLLYDDVAAVEKNPDVITPISWQHLLTNDFWGTPLKSNFSHQSYRPLTVLTFRIFGDVFRQRLFNVIIHVVNVILLSALVKRFVSSRNNSVALLFCLYPVHVETVVQLVGRAELLSGFFYLLCLLSPSYYAAILFTAFATLCKEQGITALAVKAALDLIDHLSGRQRNKSLWRDLLLSTVATISILGVRLAISGGAPTFHKFDNPARCLESPFRQINLAYLVVFNLQLLLYPHKQSCDYTFNSVALIKNYFDGRLVHLGVFALAFVWGALRLIKSPDLLSKKEEPLVNNNYISSSSKPKQNNLMISPSNSVALAGLVMTILPWLPSSNVLFYVGFVAAERVLYLPAMGLCTLVVVGFSRLAAAVPEREKFFRNILLLVYGVLLMKSSIRSRQWRSGVEVFGSAVRLFPENIKMWNNLGKAYESKGDFHLALGCYDKSISIHDDIRAQWYKAKLLSKLNKHKLAEEIYQREYHNLLDGSNNSRKEEIQFCVDYVRLLIKMDELQKAAKVISDVLTLFPNDADLNVAAGELFYYQNEKILAEESYRKALQISPRTADIYYNLGVLLMERGATDKAADMFRKCIEINPQHEPSRVNLNVLSTNTEDSQMMSLYKDAMDALREGSYVAAESLLHQVLSRHPHHPSALYNLALLQTQLGKAPSVSLAFLNRLLSVRPSHSKGLLLKANIAHKQLHDVEAAVSLYEKAYSVDKSLESALEALCDLSPSKAFSLGGSCDRDVEILTDNIHKTHDEPRFSQANIMD